MLKELLQKINKNSSYLSLYHNLEQNKKVSVISANFAEHILFLGSVPSPVCVVATSVQEAKKLKEHFEAMHKKTASIFYKLSGYIYHTAEQIDLMQEYYKALFLLGTNQLDVLIVTPEVLMQKLPQKELFLQHLLTVQTGVTYDLTLLSKALVQMGYKKEEMVEANGQFSVRGDILDVFPVQEELPFRIQFFDDEVENIKTFNTVTYTTIGEVNKVQIAPNTLIFIEEQEKEGLILKLTSSAKKAKLEPNYQVRLNNIIENLLLNLSVLNSIAALSWCLPYLEGYEASILDYLNPSSVVAFMGTKMIVDELHLLYQEFSVSIKSLQKAGEVLKEHEQYYFSKQQLSQTYENKPCLAYQSLTSQNKLFLPEAVFSPRTAPTVSYTKNYELLAKDIAHFLAQNKTVLLAGENASSSVYLEKFLKEKQLFPHIITRVEQVVKNELNIITTTIKEGVSFVEDDLVVIGSSQLFEKKKVVTRSQKSKKRTFTMPKVGEYVVHDVHGIGLCKSIARLKLSGYEKDYILIEYAGGDVVYLPTEQVEYISSYVGGEETPKLNKIGGTEFSRQKEKVKQSVKQMAVNLVALYASRQQRKGFAFVKDDEVQQAFEEAFPYTETQDQMIAINEVKADMQSEKIMDRLICGDVGYGKTEVAIRAAFKAVLSGKQVAFLAPTTILSEQHYNTCRARMSEFMVVCDVLNRFKNNNQIKQSLKNLADGTTNVICGTHRLLSKDVKFKDLGLLILDEEQRFGVSDKEKIKELKKHIDVITMSATPIPRTLHMSLIGVHDISLIETPPKDRLPVQTFVTEYSNALLTDAVNKELLRAGQVLIVHNRVDTIYTVFEKLKAMLPKVQMQVAHGQMPKNQLETVIKNLYDGNIQLLLATTLIENGIDLPNANTLIVLNSDKLGLSQLYQLRGRVGRSSRLGYAYFTYEKQKVLSESAYKRLNAINEFTELGSGFKIALRDLEIRGAGNILGREQHGHMGRVGYDMYCRILEDAIKEMKGEQLLKEREVKINLQLNSFIPQDYIESDENRFRVYSSLSTIETNEQLEQTIKEIEDIYGVVPKPVYYLAVTAFMKNLGAKALLKTIVITKSQCFIEFYEKETALGQKVNKALGQFSDVAVLKFDKGAKIKFELNNYSIEKKQEVVLKFLLAMQ